jgi:hypothetical protein
MAKPVAKASLRQSVVVPCHFASAKWHIRRIRLWRMQSGVMLNVIVTSVVAPSVVMLNVVVPFAILFR